METRTDKDPHAAFGQYKTVGWKTPPDGHDPRQNPFIDRQIRQDVTQQLTQKGYLIEDQGQPADLKISYATRASDDIVVSDGVPAPVSAQYPPDTLTYVEKKGKLMISFIDTKTNKVVWRGVVSDVISDVGPDPDQVKKGVDEVLKKFPDAPATAVG